MTSFSSPSERSFQPRTKLDYATIRAKLRSEHGPGVQSAAEMATMLDNVDKDLEDCEAEVHRLQSRIIHLRNQQQRLQEYRSCLRSLVYPIRKLPNEILSRIFDYTCDKNEVSSHDVKKQPALALNRVCSRWRELAKSCSILWSRLYVELQETAPDPRDMLIFQLHLERSGQAPLVVEIGGQATENHADILAALTQASHRWQRLHVARTTSWDVLRSSLVVSQLPLLESLELPTLRPTEINVGQNAPKLQSLVITRTPSLLPGYERKFPWQQLTFLRFGYPCESESLGQLLELCLNLTELHLWESRVCMLRRCAPRTIPALTTLSISATDTTFPQSLSDSILESLTCPSLTSLLFDRRGSGYTRSWPRKALHAFLTRSSCSLTMLSIKFIPISDADLIALLHLLPSLSDLVVDDTSLPLTETPLTSHLSRSLHAVLGAGSGIASALVPKLQSLSLTLNSYDSVSGAESFDDQEFVDMVSSRWVPDPQYASQIEVECLRSVAIRFTNREADEVIYGPLKHLEKAGMRVVIAGKGT